jgi:hypothetical protein
MLWMNPLMYGEGSLDSGANCTGSNNAREQNNRIMPYGTRLGRVDPGQKKPHSTIMHAALTNGLTSHLVNRGLADDCRPNSFPHHFDTV